MLILVKTNKTANAPETAAADELHAKSFTSPTAAARDVATTLGDGGQAIDWSNVVFSVAFCEKAKRDYEARIAI